MSDSGNGVRSRIGIRISKSARCAAASSSLTKAWWKNTTSARARKADQSAAVSAMFCQSSRTATRMLNSFPTWNGQLRPWSHHPYGKIPNRRKTLHHLRIMPGHHHGPRLRREAPQDFQAAIHRHEVRYHIERTVTRQLLVIMRDVGG